MLPLGEMVKVLSLMKKKKLYAKIAKNSNKKESSVPEL